MASQRRGVKRQISDDADEYSVTIEADTKNSSFGDRVGRSQGKSIVQRVSRSPTAHNGNKHGITLTMKVPPSKLREVMRTSELEGLKDVLGGGTMIEGGRGRHGQQPRPDAGGRASGRATAKPKYAEVQESDSDDEPEVDEDSEDQDVEMEDATAAEVEYSDDMDTERIVTAPAKAKAATAIPPKITVKSSPGKRGKQVAPRLVVTPADVPPLKSVEDQEVDEDSAEDDDEELSEVGDETNLEDEEGDLDDEQDGEAAVDPSDVDSDGELLSNTGTPDPTRMTARQRGEIAATELMQLDMAPQQRKFFTDEEKAMKKDEHARKRKELTKRKVQEEKTAALNRLLKPQLSKTRGAAPHPDKLAAQMQAAAESSEEPEKPNPLYTRWVSSKDGIKLGVPEEWLGKRVGACFGPPVSPSNGALAQELT